jgi:hypothetical protein
VVKAALAPLAERTAKEVAHDRRQAQRREYLARDRAKLVTA